MDMAIQDRDRAETLEISKRLLTVLRPPAPIGVDCPQRYVREDDDRGAAGARFEIALEPLQLIGAEFAHALEGGYVDQSHEMDALVIVAIPAAALCAFAVTLQILPAVIDGSVMLARDI